MQPGVTVALAMVWIADMVGVLSTSSPLPPFVDQYSPQLPENRHGVERGPLDLVNQMSWPDHSGKPINNIFNELPNENYVDNIISTLMQKNGMQDFHQDGRPRFLEPDVFIRKMVTFNKKRQQKKSNNTRYNSVENIATVTKDSNSKQLELENEYKVKKIRNRRQRSAKIPSRKNHYFVQDVDPHLADDFGLDDEEEDEQGQYYEEMDELLRAKLEEEKREQSKNLQTRGDIPVTEEDLSDSTGLLDIPLRGDIGAANALVIATSNPVAEMTEKPKSISTNTTFTSFINATTSNVSRRLARLQKRETIDFSRKVGSRWGYGEKEGADLLKRKKSKGDKHKKRKNSKILKQHQNNRWRLHDKSQSKNFMGYRQGYRMHPSIQKQELLERKLQDYIKRNTPIDVRQNRHLHNAHNYDPRRREDNWRHPYLHNDQRGQIPNYNHQRDPNERERTKSVNPRHRVRPTNEQSRIHSYQQYHNPHENNILGKDDRNSYNPKTTSYDPRLLHKQSSDPTEGTIERTSLNTINHDPNAKELYNHKQPYNLKQHVQNSNQYNDRNPTYDSMMRNKDVRHHDQRHPTQDRNQYYDQRQTHDPRQRIQDYQNPYEQRQNNYYRHQNHYKHHSQFQDPRHRVQDSANSLRHNPHIKQSYDQNHNFNENVHQNPHQNHHRDRSSYDPRRIHDSRNNSPRYSLDASRPFNVNKSGTSVPKNMTSPSRDYEATLKEYIQRNTPIDIRSRSNYDNVRLSQPIIERSRTPPGSVPTRNNNEHSQQRRNFSSTPVDQDFQRKQEFDIRNSTQNSRSKHKEYNRQLEHWRRRQRPSQSENRLIGHQDRWNTGSPSYEQKQETNVHPADNWSRKEKQEGRYESFQRNADSYSHEEFEKLRHKPVRAKIIITPKIPHNRYKRMPLHPGQKGPIAERFPEPVTNHPPIPGPSSCIWSLVKCCPNAQQNMTQTKKCLVANGCPEMTWDDGPCRKFIVDDAINVVKKYYASYENV